jgi:Holliday junction resolvase RusA-like endonuclease
MELKLNLNPIPCPRPRIRVVGRKFATAYYPAAYQRWKTDAAEIIRLQLPAGFVAYERKDAVDRRRNTRIAVYVAFNAQRPKSTSLDDPKPDIDNYIKAFLDACTTAGVWTDDCVVVRVTALKRWADVGCIVASITPEPK